jgi:hypothetical protein
MDPATASHEVASHQPCGTVATVQVWRRGRPPNSLSHCAQMTPSLHTAWSLILFCCLRLTNQRKYKAYNAPVLPVLHGTFTAPKKQFDDYSFSAPMATSRAKRDADKGVFLLLLLITTCISCWFARDHSVTYCGFIFQCTSLGR